MKNGISIVWVMNLDNHSKVVRCVILFKNEIKCILSVYKDTDQAVLSWQ